MKKLCNSLKKMFKQKNLFLLFTLFIGQMLWAQESQVVIRSVDEIPNVVQEQLTKDLLHKTRTDSLTTQLIDSLNQDEKFIFSYSLLKEGNQLKGTFSKEIECDNCPHGQNVWSYDLKLHFVYCCKDPDHDPAEVELSAEEMKKTQEEKGCKKIGVCFMR